MTSQTIRVYKTMESGHPFTASYRRIPIYGVGKTIEEATRDLLRKAPTRERAEALMISWPN